MKNKTIHPVTVILIIILFIISFIGGGVFWLYQKANHFSSSALSNIQGSKTVAPTSTSPLPQISMPSESAPGKDIPEVPLLPGSIRSDYFEADNGKFFSAEYTVKNNSENVLDFFKANLKGWNMTSSDQKVLSFFKSSQKELVIQIVAEDQTLSIAKYSISLALTEEN